MADCDQCSDLRLTTEIRPPGEFRKALRVIRANLSDGSIDDITQPAHSPLSKFEDLSESGPWPDYVEHYFECTGCGWRFRLAVDTYHGGGGAWEGELEAFKP